MPHEHTPVRVRSWRFVSGVAVITMGLGAIASSFSWSESVTPEPGMQPQQRVARLAPSFAIRTTSIAHFEGDAGDADSDWIFLPPPAYALLVRQASASEVFAA